MELELVRLENDRYYLYGSMYKDGDFLCDTLEFGSDIKLKCGSYSVKLLYNYNNVPFSIGIFNDNLELVALFSNNELLKYKEIELRKENSNIVVGLRNKGANFSMCESSWKLLKTYIAGAINGHNKVTLVIKKSNYYVEKHIDSI
jgi:hypothetical protein